MLLPSATWQWEAEVQPSRSSLTVCSAVNNAGHGGQAGFSISRYDRLYGRNWQADAQGGITFLRLDDGVSIFIPQQAVQITQRSPTQT